MSARPARRILDSEEIFRVDDANLSEGRVEARPRGLHPVRVSHSLTLNGDGGRVRPV